MQRSKYGKYICTGTWPGVLQCSVYGVGAYGVGAKVGLGQEFCGVYTDQVWVQRCKGQIHLYLDLAGQPRMFKEFLQQLLCKLKAWPLVAKCFRLGASDLGSSVQPSKT